MRPQKLNEVVGQQHLIGEGKVLTQMVASGNLPSIIFWGPPGIGKTTIARILADEMDLLFFQLSAVSSGVKEVRKVIETAEKAGTAVLFIDEIHRFSKSQQDALLGAVEKGTSTRIGGKTEKPCGEEISALLSRCQVYTLEPLGKEELLELMDRAMQEDKVISEKQVELKETGVLLRYSGGDARRLLNLFEMIVTQTKDKTVEVTNDIAENLIQQKMARYDKSGEQHYDIISAFIKSIRGSDPNAALYWLARMIEGGEEPKFIARRLLILASEDIGNANPNALLLANATFDAVERIGYPECTLNLAQCVTYLATSAKSNASYEAIKTAQAKVKQTSDLPVPLNLRNAPTKMMKDLG
jgi:putative ATPase